ncbi:GIDE domain-containing protein [Solimonas terrae]|uniref:RING-type E3 ubiquitin transferase n=1 Tax=Solimonas terrae TaxID=1396819 RepID=A0A6M2BVA2_9GAMM|nr:GIDE domain-containing protein [Solimonas terrae]NGY05877.1 hypothetical protein [Solimonas terrae]
MLIDFGRSIAAAAPGSFWTVVVILGGAAPLCFLLAFGRLREARLMQDTPTSRVRSAAQGYVELEGYARLMPGPDIISPLSRARCVWWRYVIEHRDQRSDSRRGSEWQVIEKASSDELFMLADGSGNCIIDPHGAQTMPSLKRRWRGNSPRPIEVPARTPWFGFGNFRYTEELICVGDPLYALGLFRSQTSVLGEDEAGDVRELLQDWKRDRRELLRRFDANGDGEIDVGEWDAARTAALAEVRAGQLERSLQPDLHVLCKPPDQRRFLISTLSQEQLVDRLRHGALALLGVSLLSGLAAVWLLVLRGLF